MPVSHSPQVARMLSRRRLLQLGGVGALTAGVPGTVAARMSVPKAAGGVAGEHDAPADAPYLGSVLSKVRPSQMALASYVWLIKCVGDPVFCAPNIGTGGSLGPPFAPLFVGSAENNPATPNFKAPDALMP